ncbi:hypothetical protein [Fodinicurvata sp. EGI_FJ10296]|uniref:hypothetical protein n=1 Tax=Fodinicurvata sp. EGI_FJ10296 TaxID=3231908 RepID=UPI0034552531
MTAPIDCQIIGRWRIVGADLWERDYLDLVGPATFIVATNGRGEITFGALQAGFDIGYSRTIIHFTWRGFDEMDEVAGTGSAELLDDGALEIEFIFDQGDEAILTAVRDSFSAAC